MVCVAMGFFSKMFGTSEPVAPERGPARTLAVCGLAPGLSMEVLFHAIENVSGRFWSFVSSGLASDGQREIVFTLRLRERETEEAWPRAFGTFLQHVQTLARQGSLVGPGDYTEFGPSGFLESHIDGIAYGSAQPIEGVPVPPGALAGVLLARSEVQVAKSCGAHRVLARLGLASRAYPFTYWSERDRQAVAQTSEVSLLNQVARVPMPGVSLLHHRDKLTMEVERSKAEQVAERLAKIPPDVAFALLTEPSREANGWLVWHVGQDAPTAITPPGSDGSQLTGFHLLIAAGVQEDGVRLREDGFAMLLRAESWERIKDAIRGRSTLRLAASGMAFELVWVG